MTTKINYIEIPVRDIETSKQFFAAVFGWSYTDYGSDYVAIHGAGIDAGMFTSEQGFTQLQGSALLVLYAEDLAAMQQAIQQQGGKIVKPVFSFPGGRRFHFCDLNGNEYALWSDK